MYLVHGGPGLDDSYFYPYFNNLKDLFEIESHTIGNTITDENVKIEHLVLELVENINRIDCENIILFGHSFGAALIIELLSSKKILCKKPKQIIFSNWIVDNKWINLFYDKNPEASEINYSQDFKNYSLKYLQYYFEDTKIGEKVLKNINYNSSLYFSFIHYLLNLDLHEKLQSIDIPISSISSGKDRITPNSYITYNVTRHNITNYCISNAGHFPFIEETILFKEVIKNIVKEYSE